LYEKKKNNLVESNAKKDSNRWLKDKKTIWIFFSTFVRFRNVNKSQALETKSKIKNCKIDKKPSLEMTNYSMFVTRETLLECTFRGCLLILTKYILRVKIIKIIFIIIIVCQCHILCILINHPSFILIHRAIVATDVCMHESKV
jgi:hypothetical protein